MSTSLSPQAVPLRWPAAWTDPRHLEILKGTPIGILIDAPAAVANAARFLNLTSMTRDQAAASAQFPADPVWPGIHVSKKAGEADAGPTGVPWVDANGWLIQLARALNPTKPVWVEAVPDKDTVQTDASYLLAIAEPAAYGARWVITLDEPFAKGLAAGDAPLVARWSKMADALRFFEAHRAWTELEPRTSLAVVSDFAGDNEFMGREFLNLAARRYLACQILPRSEAQHIDPALPAIVYLDEQPPDATLTAALERAVRAGTVLIAARGSGAAAWGQSATAAVPVPGYEWRTLGKGSIVVPAKKWDDPYLVAADVRILIGRRSDVLRLFNAGSMSVLYARAKDGRTGLIHVLNYTGQPVGHEVSIAPADNYSRAQMLSPEHPTPELVKIAARRQGFSEIPVPPFGVYSAIELA